MYDKPFAKSKERKMNFKMNFNRILQEQEQSEPRWRDTIVDFMATSIFISEYSSMIERYCEDNDFTYNDLPDELPYAGSGEDWMDNHPPVTEEAKELADNVAKEYEKMNGKSLDALLEDAAEADGVSVDDIDSDFASDFGYYLGLMALGEGAGWFDNHEKFPLKHPYTEFYLDVEDFISDEDDDFFLDDDDIEDSDEDDEDEDYE